MHATRTQRKCLAPISSDCYVWGMKKTKPKTPPPQVNLTVRVPLALYVRLKEVAEKQGTRQSQLARIILADGLAVR